ncbi:autoinducer binding domain-containing protein [Oricola sp.]|uniref:autoinducer binding domain-containing protein n=1 Tax=Oricola sp. TaxID=1979950 RepID=UPI000C8F8263|nr:LuxR family transcriptional regulator [Ahrensia sp.]|tara:strand:- start:6741 stop:7481 length:741 start_codon:yes stop_codon:yes gene_type:complete
MAQTAAPLNDEAGTGFVDRIADCKTSYDILRLTREIAKSYDFQYFSIMRLPSADERALASLYIISNWPPDLINSYDQLGLLEHSPVISALRRSTKPFVWRLEDVNRNRADGREDEIETLFAAYGFHRGVYFPAQEPSGERGAVSFSGSRDTPSNTELMELSFLSNLIYEKVAEIKKPAPTPDQTLSARERECLHWTASGKTSSEIATILELSEHTVNHYLSAACQKLGATNRAHAVARAIRAGLVD